MDVLPFPVAVDGGLHYLHQQKIRLRVDHEHAALDQQHVVVLAIVLVVQQQHLFWH